MSSYPGAVPLDTEFPTGIRCTGPSGDTAANAEDQLCEYGGFSYTYNLRGQLESKSDGAATTTYTYDGLGRLKRVTEPGMDIHYVHDALGRRIGKVRDGNLEKGWLYADALNPIAQLDSSGNIEATFLYGTRAHVPDAMVMTDGTVYRFITDHLGSVRLVVNAATGEVVQRMDYDAFGRVLNAVNPDFQPFGFAGGLYDHDTELVRFGARDHDSHSGRWTAKDPILFDGGLANLYSYVGADPINLIDPSGRIIWILPAVAAGTILATTIAGGIAGYIYGGGTAEAAALGANAGLISGVGTVLALMHAPVAAGIIGTLAFGSAIGIGYGLEGEEGAEDALKAAICDADLWPGVGPRNRWSAGMPIRL